ncbi:MAG: hypothetical protein QXE79_02135 [Candidatus Bathyarchaeia archaeon]
MKAGPQGSHLTSIILILLAARLLGCGMRELMEYLKCSGVEVGWPGSYAYDLKISEGPIPAVMLG